MLVDEKLADNAERQGQKLRQRLGELQRDASRVTAVRGKGLMNAIVIEERDGVNAYDVCMRLRDNGLLVGPICQKLRTFQCVLSSFETLVCRLPVRFMCPFCKQLTDGLGVSALQ